MAFSFRGRCLEFEFSVAELIGVMPANMWKSILPRAKASFTTESPAVGANLVDEFTLDTSVWLNVCRRLMRAAWVTRMNIWRRRRRIPYERRRPGRTSVVGAGKARFTAA